MDSNRISITKLSTDVVNSEFKDKIVESSDLVLLWSFFSGVITFFMQTGFTLLEAGSVKHTNVQNIMFKNVCVYVYIQLGLFFDVFIHVFL